MAELEEALTFRVVEVRNLITCVNNSPFSASSFLKFIFDITLLHATSLGSPIFFLELA